MRLHTCLHLASRFMSLFVARLIGLHRLACLLVCFHLVSRSNFAWPTGARTWLLAQRLDHLRIRPRLGFDVSPQFLRDFAQRLDRRTTVFSKHLFKRPASMPP